MSPQSKTNLKVTVGAAVGILTLAGIVFSAGYTTANKDAKIDAVDKRVDLHAEVLREHIDESCKEIGSLKKSVQDIAITQAVQTETLCEIKENVKEINESQ